MEKDTSPKAREQYYQMLRNLTPEERLTKTLSLIKGVSDLALASLREQHPDKSPDQIFRLFALKMHGSKTSCALFAQSD